MARQYKKPEDNTNYSFLLKCMAALTAAAVVTAGVIAAVSLKSGAAATTAALAAKMTVASAFIFMPLFPIALVVIGLICILPFLFGSNKNTYTTINTTPGYRSYGNYGFYSTPIYSSPVYTDTYHGHYDTGTVYSNNVHGHTTSGTTHGHDTHTHHGHDTNTHGHSTSVNVHRH